MGHLNHPIAFNGFFGDFWDSSVYFLSITEEYDRGWCRRFELIECSTGYFSNLVIGIIGSVFTIFRSKIFECKINTFFRESEIAETACARLEMNPSIDRKSTRLNS